MKVNLEQVNENDPVLVAEDRDSANRALEQLAKSLTRKGLGKALGVYVRPTRRSRYGGPFGIYVKVK